MWEARQAPCVKERPSPSCVGQLLPGASPEPSPSNNLPPLLCEVMPVLEQESCTPGMPAPHCPLELTSSKSGNYRCCIKACIVTRLPEETETVKWVFNLPVYERLPV